MPRTLHVCNGDSTAGSLRTAGAPGAPGAVAVLADVLAEGPCPPVWDAAWWDVRAGFLASAGHDDERSVRAQLEAWDRTVVDALTGATPTDELVLWYEHDLFDQLLLIRLLALVERTTGAAASAPPLPALSLVSIDAHPDVADFRGLGQLRPDQLVALYPTRAPITAAMRTLGAAAWSAYTAPDPRALVALLDGDLAALRFLARALRRHLEEYPGSHDGLSRTERALLATIDGGVTASVPAWLAVLDGEDAYYVADASFEHLLADLAAPPAALIEVHGRTPAGRLLGRDTTLALTPHGRDVLAGTADRLADGVDRWLGGVHLDDAATAWRWDRATARLVAGDAAA